LTDGFYYYDAEVDDSRLVLRVLQEGIENGGQAMNYTRASQLLFDPKGKVCGVHLVDLSPDHSGREKDVEARVVIHATGPWSDLLRCEVEAPARIRKQRGSHLIFSRDRLPLDNAITFFHPRDKRAMFVFPWEGVTMIGTTDLDHPLEYEQTHPEPFITRAEVQYTFEALEYLFPKSALTEADVISSFAGLRPIVSSGTGNPSKESRAHCLWEEKGLITITGGKLTTYRIMALEALKRACERLPERPIISTAMPMFMPLPAKPHDVAEGLWQRLAGRYGNLAGQILDTIPLQEMANVPGNTALWSEIRWAVRAEAVEHLDDLLLRRVRIGLTDRQGGLSHLEAIQSIVQAELGWDEARWAEESSRYLKRWKECYYLPE
jgi:glycerol-3-phosphate dehydrogenase